MKPCKSNLIERFIDHVASGAIVGDGYTIGPDVLLDVTEALRRILDGAEPDAALAIDRAPGGRPDEESVGIAYLWHRLHEKHGCSVDSVAMRVFEIYGKNLTERRLRAIYEQHGEPDLWRVHDEVDELLARPRRAAPPE